MSGLTTEFFGAVAGLGRSFLVSCCLPAALFLLVNQYLLWPAVALAQNPTASTQTATPEPTKPANPEDAAQTPSHLAMLTQFLTADLEALAGTMLWAVLVGLVLSSLNHVIVRGFEGKLPWLRYGLLAYWAKRNQHRSAELYSDLVKMQQKYREIGAKLVLETDLDQQQFLQGLMGTLAQEIGATHTAIEAKVPFQYLPRDVERVAPTNFGNIYAMAEEYAYERYGVDAVLFWPRLRGLMLDHPASKDHSERISGQKTSLDLVLNFALLSALLVIEALFVLFFAHGYRYPIVWVVLVSGALLAIAFYHAAIAAIAALGELIKMSFDYYRHLLLESFNLQKPTDLNREQLMWVQLAAFVRRGDEFYFPSAFVVTAH